jgi:hypothetical protein
MAKRLQRLILAIGMVGNLLVLGGGCAVNRTPRGWLVRTGCTLEYTRPLHCSLRGPASGNCITADPGETHADSESSGEALSADAAAEIIGNKENSLWLRLLQRRGRLGICANCKRLMRIGASPSAPPPMAGTVPVNPRFNPVPTQPVFTVWKSPPESGSVPTVPGDQQAPGPPLLSPPSSPSTTPEEIPAPPAAARSVEGDHTIFGDHRRPSVDGARSVPEKSGQTINSQQDSSSKESSWVFSKPPLQKPDPVIEIPPPSAFSSYGVVNGPRGAHASQSSTRR